MANTRLAWSDEGQGTVRNGFLACFATGWHASLVCFVSLSLASGPRRSADDDVSMTPRVARWEAKLHTAHDQAARQCHSSFHLTPTGQRKKK